MPIQVTFNLIMKYNLKKITDPFRLNMVHISRNISVIDSINACYISESITFIRYFLK